MKKYLQGFKILTVSGSLLIASLNNAYGDDNLLVEETSFIEEDFPNEFAGVAYENSRTVPAIAPIIAVGAVVIITAVAVVLHGRDNNRIRLRGRRDSNLSLHAHA